MSIGNLREETLRSYMSESQRTFVSRIIRSHRLTLRVAFSFILIISLAFTAFVIILLTKAMGSELMIIIFGSLFTLAILILLLVYLGRRIFTVIDLSKPLLQIRGRFNILEKGVGRTRRELFYIGEQLVGLPPDWLNTHIKPGDEVTAICYFVPFTGIDTREGLGLNIVLELPGRATVGER